MRFSFKFRSIAIFSILFFTSSQLISQTDFRNGYIVKNDSDTIYGLIDYKGNKANSRKCIFKSDIKSEKQEFTPNDIKEYKFIDSKYYVSKPVTTGNKTDLLFFEYLINGIVDIYYYRDDVGEHYYVDPGDGNLIELKNNEKEVLVNNTKYIKSSKEYIGLLKYTFKESPTISKKVESLGLNHKSLINIAHDYHNAVCLDKECIIYEKKMPKVLVKFGPVVGLNGVSISAARAFPQKLEYLNNSKFKLDVYPSVGMFVKVNIPDLNERFFLQYELSINHFNLKTTNRKPGNGSDMDIVNEITLVQNALTNTILIRYELPNNKIRPAFFIGAFTNSYFNVDYTRKYDLYYSWGDNYYSEKYYKSPFRKSEFGLNLGGGIITHIFKGKDTFLDLRYKRGFGFIEGLNSNYFMLNIGFEI